MGSWSDASSDGKVKVARRPLSNYKVRFRHGVFPHAEDEATRADIKKYDYFFSGEQTWVATPEYVVDFIDESDQVAADLQANDHRLPVDGSRRPSRRLIRTRTAERLPQGALQGLTIRSDMSIRPAAYSAVSTAMSSAAPSTASSSPRQAVYSHRRHTSPAPSSISSYEEGSSIDWQHDSVTPGGPYATTSTTRVPWPLSDPIEAQLFRFWVDTAAQWWDITSSHSVFKEVVPQLALNNSILLNAIFMIACQHIRRYDAAFPARPFLYHDRVLQQLIPHMAENGRIQDEATLVAAVFVRGFEELHAGTRGQYHLSTYELFHGSDGWLFNMSSPVVQACFMVHVHFEVYQGLLNQPSLRVDYRTYSLPDLASPSDDVAWGNRIVWTCAEILHWYHMSSRTSNDWKSLHSKVDEWERDRPSGFNAFFYRDADIADGRRYPELWFPNICHGRCSCSACPIAC
ncbi:hypothetical protein EK21DRAFT_101336 [Setomelanomma holmii]|uniref:Uncharacterized protein n=1 Tax=Setomelanomma holmii TaxID=210430 RepID=A0A9P4H7S9_9PLEO|nr:hypothetical protein EK21DRAFT_101336 [Setomelanomma holmii]